LYASSSLPPNTYGFALGLNAGFTFTVSSGTVASVSLTTPSLSASIFTILNATFQLGCFQLSGSSYNYVAITVNPIAGTITLPLAPTTSTYVFVTFFLQLPPVIYNTAVSVVANANQTYQWGANAATEFAIQFNSSVSNQITVTKANVSTQAQVVFGTPLNVYFRISATTSTGFNALLKYAYTSAQLTAAGIVDATKLQFSVYSTVSSSWVTPPLSGWVDVNAQIVYQPTNSFSDWSVTANVTLGPTSSTASNSSNTSSSTAAASGAVSYYSIRRTILIVPILSLIYFVLLL